MADNKTNISFYHLAEGLSSVSAPVNGTIYFSDADHTIGVGVGSEMKKYYGGNVKNAVYAGKKLTISYYDGVDAVLDFNDVASAEGVSTLLSGLRDDIKALRTDVTALQGASHTHTNKTVLDGITDVKVAAWDAVAGEKADYDAHIANADIHVTAEQKTAWDGKQDALSADQLAAANSGITAAKVSGYNTHVGNADIHVTAEQKTAWDGKQAALTEAQLNAVNSGITAAKVGGYDNHLNNQDIHVTTADKAKWNAAEQNAMDYADGLAKNYDKAGAAATALADAKTYTDGKITDLNLGSASQKNVLTGAIADSSSDDLVTAAQVKAYASGVVGAMHFRGAVENTSEITDPASGDICLVGTKEYVYNGTKWVLFGDESAYDIKGSAAQALTDAKKYTDDTKSDVLGNANTDTKDSATIVGAKKYADSLAVNYDAAGSAAQALTDAKKYTDDAKSAVLGNAGTDTKDSATIVGAKKYTDDAKSTVIGNAETDTKESATIVGAKKYTDDAKAAANAYTDEAISAALVWVHF